MARICQVTGKKVQRGHNVSHANNKTKRCFLPNIQSKRVKLESGRFVAIRATASGLRTLDKMLNDMTVDQALIKLGLL